MLGRHPTIAGRASGTHDGERKVIFSRPDSAHVEYGRRVVDLGQQVRITRIAARNGHRSGRLEMLGLVRWIDSLSSCEKRIYGRAVDAGPDQSRAIRFPGS